MRLGDKGQRTGSTKYPEHFGFTIRGLVNGAALESDPSTQISFSGRDVVAACSSMCSFPASSYLHILHRITHLFVCIFALSDPAASTLCLRVSDTGGGPIEFESDRVGVDSPVPAACFAIEDLDCPDSISCGYLSPITSPSTAPS